jgi:hypothetical protein
MRYYPITLSVAVCDKYKGKSTTKILPHVDRQVR